MSAEVKLPSLQTYDDGYDHIPVDGRLIKGGILRCNVLDTGNSWQLADKVSAYPGPYLAPMTRVVVQRWENNRPVETIYEKRNEPTNIEALNARIPESEWALGFDNKRRARPGSGSGSSI
jgi:hypothetical protein